MGTVLEQATLHGSLVREVPVAKARIIFLRLSLPDSDCGKFRHSHLLVRIAIGGEALVSAADTVIHTHGCEGMGCRKRSNQAGKD